MRNMDKGVSSGYEHERVSRCAGKGRIRTRTYESPVDSAYGTKGAHSGNGESEFV